MQLCPAHSPLGSLPWPWASEADSITREPRMNSHHLSRLSPHCLDGELWALTAFISFIPLCAPKWCVSSHCRQSHLPTHALGVMEFLHLQFRLLPYISFGLGRRRWLHWHFIFLVFHFLEASLWWDWNKHSCPKRLHVTQMSEWLLCQGKRHSLYP